jgi:hypothetical protein
MRRMTKRVAGVLLALVLSLAACGDGSSGGAEGEQNPGQKTEDKGGGY